MTHFEQRLLTAIEGDSRYDTAELAVRLGVAEAEIVEALMKLEQDGDRTARDGAEKEKHV